MKSIPIAAPRVSDAAKEAVCDVLDSGVLTDGPVVRRFEDEFADYVGTTHAVATSSGTTALHAMLEAADIGEGDVVLTSPFSFVASANAIVHAGADPAFADVDPETFNLAPDDVRDVLAVRDDVTALMPVHLYGLPAQMDEFRAIADAHDLLLFEDAAQAHGATFGDEQVGAIGDAAAFSFYPTKNMTTGEGGMVVTDDDSIAARLRKVVDHGRTGHYEHSLVGYNFRMTDIAAAIGREQLRRLPEWVERRRANAAEFTDAFESVTGVETPTVPNDRTHSFHQYTVEVEDRPTVVESLEAHDVGYGIYYPRTIPDQQAYRCDEETPVADELTDRVLSLPVHPQLDAADVETVVSAVREGVTR